jgi:hypothetical protein
MDLDRNFLRSIFEIFLSEFDPSAWSGLDKIVRVTPATSPVVAVSAKTGNRNRQSGRRGSALTVLIFGWVRAETEMGGDHLVF